MSKKHGALTGNTVESATTFDSNAGEAPQYTGDSVSTTDLLSYMSDMLIELRSIADRNGFRTLSGLLALAHAEAAARQDEITTRRLR